MAPTLNLVHLYPNIMNLYGDRGNIITLNKRCAWRGIELVVHELGLRAPFPDAEVDILFMGGDQDREQSVVSGDLQNRHAARIRAAVEQGVPFLAVCGGFQLLQNSYLPAEGPELLGIGIFDAHTVHPGSDAPRCVGNIVADWEGETLVGFENHGGRTYLDGDTKPLATVRTGYGNNGVDHSEGARVLNAFGTYIHGSLLPKNPVLADCLLSLALHRRFGDFPLQPLDDSAERSAHSGAVASATK